ncbi:MAG: 4-hydroxyphenylacetate 3-hydroxylase family protein [Candidatus Bathyarchaeia archaeon]
MVVMSGEEYLKSLTRLKPTIYVLGTRVENAFEHPMLRAAADTVAVTYDLAKDPKYEGLMTARSHVTGERINRFTHVHQSVEDLVKKVKMLRLLGRKTGTCFQRCTGLDGLNSLSIVTYEMDRELGTSYYDRFVDYVKRVQENDLSCALGMTDVKGNRKLRPSQQADPDLYLRVVEKDEEGIVVRGAKACITGTAAAHEMIVMPTRAMREEDKGYAVSFAVPSDTEGVVQVVGRKPGDLRYLEKGVDIDLGNVGYAPQEALVTLNDVFVPWERVFMCGEHQFAGRLVECFTAYHRQNYGGCKAGNSDVLIGASALIAEYNGVATASHIRDKLVEMIHLTETMYGLGIACSSEGYETPSGTYIANPLLANVCKHNVTRFPYEISRLAHDIAGGLVSTMPSEKDFRHEELGRPIDKYLRGVADVPTEHRMRVLRLIENMTFGVGSVYLLESMHGAGSPQAQRIVMARAVDIEELKELAKAVAGIRGS